jgi:hypothetical protein
MEATVNTFSGYLVCEPASLIVINISEYAPMGHLFHSEAQITFNLTSPSCTVTNVTYSPSVSFDQNDPYNVTGDFTWGFGGLMDCVQEGQSRIHASVGTYRADVVWTGTDIEKNLTLPWDQMFRVVNSTNIFCTPQFEIMKSRVSKISTTTSPDILGSITPLGQGSSLPGRGMDIARAVFQSIGGYANLIEQSNYANGSNYTSDFTTLDTFFAILQQERPFFGHAKAASEFWFQLDNLIRETNVVYGSIAAQVAALELLVASNGDIDGTVTTNELRLFMRTLSFALMEVGLGLLTLFATYLLLTVSKSILRHDPGSISGMAAIVSRSPRLVELVSNVATRPISATKAKLQERTYYTDIQHGLLRNGGIHVSERLAPGVQSQVAESDPGGSSVVVWWQPFVLRKFSRLMVILTPLLYISILEILFTFSQSNDGLLGIDNNSWAHYGWTYLPALLILCLHVLYTSVSFNIRLLTPYLTLHRGSVPALVSVVDHPLSRTALHELFWSVRRGQRAVFAITVAMLLAPLLTIAVSGLYTAENYVQYAEARVLTGWNFNYAHLYPNATLVQNVFNYMNESNPASTVMESTGSLATDLIVTANLSYPKWSHEELALPVIEVTSPKHDNRTFSSQSASFEVSLPAVRAALNCTAIAHENVEINYAIWNSSFSEPTYNSSSSTFSYSAAYNSTLGVAKAGNLACLNYQAQYLSSAEAMGLDGCRIAIFSTNSTQQLGGCSTPPEVLFLPNETGGAESFGYFSPFNLDSSYWHLDQTYCPLYGGMVGSTTSSQVEDYTWFVCSTSVQCITTRVTFTMPDYEIVQAQADESTVSLIPGNGSMAISDGPVDEYGNLLDITFRGPNAALISGAQGNLVDGNNILTFYNTSDGQNFDNFFSSLVYGRYGIPIDEMLGKANSPRLMSAVEHLWRVLYAQTFRTSPEYLSADPRDIEAWTPQQPLDVTLVDRNAFRLKQSEIATRILQGLLAAISLFALVAFWPMDTGRVLPNKPSSIAVVASLLAGSEMLNIAEVQAGKEEIAKLNRSRWDGYFFSLGWWEQPGGTRRFGIDVGKAEKAI